jgi:HD-GYP domain-containing protein (c-di-GMP phosphodiesterase class II)
VVLHHHERIDGAGWPEGLAGPQISHIARMAAICDGYDAITSNRPYKQGWDPAEALARMASWKGQFDEARFEDAEETEQRFPHLDEYWVNPEVLARMRR